MGTLLIWLVVLLPIFGPAITLTRKGRSLWVWGAALIGAYCLFLTPPMLGVVEGASEPGDGGGKMLIYFIAVLVGVFVNAVVLLYKVGSSIFHTDGYGH
ncbi:hypothetical protein ACFQRC_08635 [Enterovirga sp. GCM10030262]|uniref:hypothetical protein n=1 Tax=Enterovirga sp. GCM10030262 TaxID=3273391 RepID=UPI00361FE45F